MKQYLDPLQQEAHEAFFIIDREGPGEVLPPHLSKKDFLEILSQLRLICGLDNVVTGKDLVEFVDPFAVNTAHIPSAAVWYVHSLMPLLAIRWLMSRRVYTDSEKAQATLRKSKTFSPSSILTKFQRGPAREAKI